MNRRPLKKIAAEIATLLKREVKSVIEIGGLLAEAKEQIDQHGEWLTWLSENFPLTPRTAQNYMSASALADKYETVSHSRLTVSAVYALVHVDRNGNADAVEAALSEAKDKWVDDERVYEIFSALSALRREEASEEEPSSDESSDEASSSDEEPPSDEEARDEELSLDEDSDDRPEPEPADDRPPPTPPPSLTPKQAAQLSKFETATKELQGLSARSAREFLAASMSDFDLETLADFLHQVVREREKLRTAGGGQGGDAVQMEEAKS